MPTGKDLNDLAAFLLSGEAGNYIFRQGDEGAELFLLQQGQVELLDERSGQSTQLAILNAGDSFGEAQVFAPGPRSVSARGVTDFQAFRIDHPTLVQIVSEDVSVAVGMIERLATRTSPALPPEGTSPPPTPEIVSEPAHQAEAAVPTGDPVLSVADGSDSIALTGKDEFVVGRLDRTTGFVPDVDLTAHDHDRALSRRHARIVVRDGRVFVREDKKSRNGTFVNGTRIDAGVDIELDVGATVRFGLVETVFERRR